MAEEDNVLYFRDSDTPSSEDVWDDSALIKAYDKAINLAKEEVSKRMGVENESSGSKQKTKSHKQSNQSQKYQQKWVVGSPCRAIYSDDGQEYEAVITKIFESTGTCLVTFIGYNNEETVKLSSLLESEGLQSQIAQQKEAEQLKQPSNSMEFEESHKRNGYVENQMDCGTSSSKAFKSIYQPSFSPAFGEMPPAPPLPPQLMARLPENDADALSSMLMSWYISGFHTGYYHGLKQARGQRKK